MFRTLISSRFGLLNRSLSLRLFSTENKLQIISNEEFPLVKEAFSKTSPLDKLTEDDDITHVAPYLKPSFNFAAYVNKSETLQELLKLGVDLHKLECKKNVPQYILGLDFKRDIQKHVEFLHNNGLSVDDIGEFITKCPFIFKEDIENLEVRINYLKAKKFTDDMIVRILTCNPSWLTFSVKQIDERLGFFQKEFSLSGDEVRLVASKKPALITFDLAGLKLRIFVMKEEMGFNDQEAKQILIKKPNIYMRGQSKLLRAFEYLHRDMNIPSEMILQNPEVLTCRVFRLRERHLFLEKLGKAQYDPKKPNYVSLTMLTSGTDAEFCTEIAKSSIQAYNMFLKSL